MKNRVVAILVGMLVCIILSGMTVAQAGVVISQVYGGGGNAGAPYTNDFVELFNNGSTPISLNSWSIQYASATGTGNFGSNPITLLSGTLNPGRYLLAQEAGGSNGGPLPTPDVTGTVAMSATGGKVILASVTSGLPCNGGSTQCPAAQLNDIVDLIGWGAANFFEGSVGPGPTTSNILAAIRNGGGCIDTNNNAADFVAGAPSPRNSSSPANICSAVTTSEPQSLGVLLLGLLVSGLVRWSKATQSSSKSAG